MEPKSSLPCPQETASGLYLSHLKPARILTLYFFKVRFNIIILSPPQLHLDFHFSFYN
jgi:hypothetical protein